MVRRRFSFTGELWRYEGPGGWHFISLPEAEADEIEAMFASQAKGFGSLRVEATIGRSRWSTSISADRTQGTYLLPVRRAVRTAEDLAAGSTTRVDIAIIA